MARALFPKDARFLSRAARACKEILVDGAQQDAVLSRFGDDASTTDNRKQIAQLVIPVIKHHGLLNYIIHQAARAMEMSIPNDKERHFFSCVVIFHVFKNRIENGSLTPFSDAEKKEITLALKNPRPRIDDETCMLVSGAIHLDVHALLREKDVVERWSILHSHPSWFIDRLRRLLPDERVERILQAQQAPEAFFLAVRDASTLDRVARFLASNNIVFQRNKMLPSVLQISNLTGAKRRLIEKKWINVDHAMIQDLASVAVLEALNVVEGDVVIDACAAPFQKSAGIWWRNAWPGTIIAMDANFERAASNAARLPAGVRRFIHVAVADAARLGSSLRGIVPDKILIDMPCTGSGSLAAYPELKARQRTTDVAFFSRLQGQILESVLDACIQMHWKDVHVVYSTCSYYPEEGEDIIDEVMDKIELVDLHDPRGPGCRLAGFPAGWKGHACSKKVVRTFPDLNDGSKAFFIAAFTPKA